MPFTQTFEDHGVVHHFYGTVTFSEVVALQDAKWNSDQGAYLKFTLLTFAEDVTFRISTQEQALLLRRHDANQHSRAHMKFAFVIPNDHVEAQLAGVFWDAPNAENLTVRRFPTVEAARAWIKDDGAGDMELAAE